MNPPFYGGFMRKTRGNLCAHAFEGVFFGGILCAIPLFYSGSVRVTPPKNSLANAISCRNGGKTARLCKTPVKPLKNRPKKSRLTNHRCARSKRNGETPENGALAVLGEP